jgi:diaminohydroxyphosphoribosylaminopyrimidine deaminase/5-amino-6-(5-phosphoribosylamino)uracil reductase
MQEKYMRRAIELALKGAGHVNPNPMVGCVVVRDDKIIAEGYHEQCGQFHAERNALTRLNARGETAEGADLYVTLEPCCHYGRTPPCTEIIIQNKVKRVFVGSDDPNPKVAGKGFQILREAGIEVIPHVLKEECDQINQIFFHYITHQTPFVILKYAMTLDGKTACYTGSSQWISGEESRRHVHQTRNLVSGIMTGIGTVLADDPMLNCRIPGGVDPKRIICDSSLRIPLDSQIVRTAGEIPTYVAYVRGDEDKQEALALAGVNLLEMPEKDGRVDLRLLMERLAQEEKIDSILLEGGPQLNFSALSAGIVQKVQAYIAPKLIGGQEAKTPVGGQGLAQMADAWTLTEVKTARFGEDLYMEGLLCSQA